MKDADEWVGPTLANTSSFFSAVTSSTFFVALIVVRGQTKLSEVFEATDSEAPKENNGHRGSGTMQRNQAVAACMSDMRRQSLMHLLCG